MQVLKKHFYAKAYYAVVQGTMGVHELRSSVELKDADWLKCMQGIEDSQLPAELELAQVKQVSLNKELVTVTAQISTLQAQVAKQVVSK